MPAPGDQLTARSWLALAAFLAASVAAGFIGSLATIDAREQYQALDQPGWAPPGWLFGPVWTFLYLSMGVAAWLVWRRVGLRSVEVGLWGGQLAVNALWSPLFFAWGLRGVALAWIVLLDALVAATAWFFWRRDRIAGALLLPYLGWILFATALNWAVWSLNR